MKRYEYLIRPGAELAFAIVVAVVTFVAQALEAASFEAVYADPWGWAVTVGAAAARVGYVVLRKGVAGLLVRIAGEVV